MTVEITVDMEAKLNDAFVHYQSIRIGLGIELVDEFGKTIDGILAHPTRGNLSKRHTANVACIAFHAA
jgi:hypothetical protein